MAVIEATEKQKFVDGFRLRALLCGNWVEPAALFNQIARRSAMYGAMSVWRQKNTHHVYTCINSNINFATETKSHLCMKIYSDLIFIAASRFCCIVAQLDKMIKKWAGTEKPALLLTGRDKTSRMFCLHQLMNIVDFFCVPWGIAFGMCLTLKHKSNAHFCNTAKIMYITLLQAFFFKLVCCKIAIF